MGSAEEEYRRKRSLESRVSALFLVASALCATGMGYSAIRMRGAKPRYSLVVWALIVIMSIISAILLYTGSKPSLPFDL
jgi:hypothetical protein